MFSTGLKEKLLTLDYNDGNAYCLSFALYLDPSEAFTDFCCERTSGKIKYLHAFKEIYERDKQAEAYIIIYGVEDESYIYGNDAYVITSLTQQDVELAFSNASALCGEYISPSKIDTITAPATESDHLLHVFESGDICPIMNSCGLVHAQHLFLLCWD